ncbi:hypothetical protein LCGC14_0783250 [marine sediment metagenome]|uniref:Uncharacterized protein n=1 Tax=marine sediment metagenome TaxID=412755 RepID=A0A0F9T1V2_9ZZZZ
MTVREIIKRLQECNPDATAYVYNINRDDGELMPVHSIDNGFEDTERVDINYGE